MIDLEKYKLQSGQSTQSSLDKYRVSTVQPTYKQKEPDFIDKAGEFGASAGRSILRTAADLSSLGEKALQTPLKLFGAKFNDETSIKQIIPEELTRKPETKIEKAGDIFGEGIQYMTPVGAEKIIAKGSTILGKILTNYPRISSLSRLGVRSLVGGAELAGKTALMGGENEDIKTSGIIGAVTPPALKTLGAATKFALGDVAPSIMASMTGVAPNTIKAAFKNYKDVAKYMSEKVIPLEVRSKAIESLGKYKVRVGDTFEKELNNLSKLSPRIKQARTAAGKGFPGVFSGVKGKFEEALNKGTENLKGTLNKFRISLNGDNLNFNKLNSAIVSASEQKQIQQVWNTLRNQKDFSVRGVQDVAARINALSKYTEGAKTQSSAVISKIHSIYSNAINKVYPELGKIRREYSAAQQIISGIDDVLKSTKNDIANPNTSTSVAKKLVNLFQEDNEAYVRALKKLEDETGDDLINQFVAANFDKIMPGKLGSYLGQAGVITGAALGNPMLLSVLPLFSPKVVGRITTTAGKISNAASKIKSLKALLPSALK